MGVGYIAGAAVAASILIAGHPVLAASVEPDRILTPGAANPDVTRDNISTTICVSGWTATVRPSVPYTNRLKREQLETRDYPDRTLGDYEEDHLISLEISGDPMAEKNLWPEAYAGSCGARVKDVIERKLNRLVCSGALTLRMAQHLIATDWVAAYQRYVRPLDCD
jgi:hypothetical protein